MPQVMSSPQEIDHLIGSSAYRDSGHPQNAVTRNSVTNWFAARYGSNRQVDVKSLTSAECSEVQNSRTNHVLCRVSSGDTLLVGEGNFSFTASLVFDHCVNPIQITSTINENVRNISNDAKVNARSLLSAGVTVLDTVDATRLDRTFHHRQFDMIIFQFPNAGSREPNRG